MPLTERSFASVAVHWPTPNYTHPHTRGPELYIINSIFLFIATFCVATRLYTRISIRNWFGLDDVFISIALVCILQLPSRSRILHRLGYTCDFICSFTILCFGLHKHMSFFFSCLYTPQRSNSLICSTRLLQLAFMFVSFSASTNMIGIAIFTMCLLTSTKEWGKFCTHPGYYGQLRPHQLGSQSARYTTGYWITPVFESIAGCFISTRSSW
jgi:hypothetical protein